MYKLIRQTAATAAVILPLVLTLAPIAHADNLADVYAAAKANDPVLGAAQAGHAATEKLVPQARSALLPNISASAGTQWTERSFPLKFNNPTTGLRQGIPGDEFNDHNWRAELAQPVLDMPSWYTYTSTKASVEASKWNLAGAEQNLIVRAVAAYLDVLRVQDRLDSTVSEETAVKRQLEQVQQRFEVGLVAITDVLESQAVYDNAIVKRIQAVGDHDIFFETLRTLTGVRNTALDRLSESLPIVNPEPATEETWVETALSTNFGIRAADSQLAAARRTVRARRSGHLPTINATVTRQHFVTGGQSNFGGGGIKLDDTIYALNLRLPVFTGGFTRARTQEARALELQSREQLTGQQLTVARDTRNLFRAVATDVVRVRARLKAIKSSESALEATETGYEVGTRNIVDVLQAQQRLFSSQFDYADSRYNYVLDLMLLKQAAGALTEADITELNTFTDPNDQVQWLNSLSQRQEPATQ